MTSPARFVIRTPVLFKNGEVPVLEKDHVAGVGKQRRDVASTKCLVFANADDQRRRRLGHDDALGLSRGDDGDCVGATELLKGSSYGGFQVVTRVDLAMDQVGDNLGVGIAQYLDAVRLKASLRSR